MIFLFSGMSFQLPESFGQDLKNQWANGIEVLLAYALELTNAFQRFMPTIITVASKSFPLSLEPFPL
jgi:hypothetical protein